MENIIILYSGGADSRLMLEFALQASLKPHGLLIDYGQLHKEELDFAAEQLNKLDVPFTQGNVGFMFPSTRRNLRSGLTSGVKDETGVVHEMHVPGRNSMFLSMAFSVAEDLGIETIWIGADWSDRLNLFPDCYQEYLIRMNEVFQVAGPHPISIEAPIMGFTKDMVMILLKKFGIDEKELYSGYGEYA